MFRFRFCCILAEEQCVCILEFVVHFRFSERFGIQKLGACCWESSPVSTCCLELLARELSFPPVRPYLRGPFINDIIIFGGFGNLKDELLTSQNKNLFSNTGSGAYE